ncbi:MAG: arsenite methyltransferase [Planctomycetota bacterium]|jgi:SAM-dependent methyltransferase
MNEQKHNEIRDAVSTAYAQAVTSNSGCGSGCGTPQKGEVAKLAGYNSEELQTLPAEAVVNSFGCGNPVAFSQVKEGDVVLDLGSGAGIDILIAAKKVGPTGRAIGIDMTDEMIVKARENIAASGLSNAEVRKGIIEDLPVESSSVDWVISNCVINLSPEKPKVFSEIARVLKPGGRMLVSDIVVQDLPDWVRQNKALHTACVAGAISEQEYLQGLQAAGLENVEVRDRLVYDASQLKGLIQSDLVDANQHAACCVASMNDQAISNIAESLAGKIWSANFYAKKPG